MGSTTQKYMKKKKVKEYQKKRRERLKNFVQTKN